MTDELIDQSIMEVIKKRFSVRSYKSEILPKEVVQQLNEYIENVRGPFNKSVRFQIIEDISTLNKNNEKIGTYGVIKGAKTYIVGVVEKGDKGLEELGYTFEKIIIYATSLGLGTCWLGGTFRRNGFETLARLKDGEILAAVTPVGIIENKRTIVNSAIRLFAGSNNRKDWNELFFYEDTTVSLTKEKAGRYVTALEMLRLAPSASNKQPWRVIKEDNNWHFYLKATKGYGKTLGFDIQRIDMGIAMSHFEMTLTEAGLKGKWKVEKETGIKNGQELEYIVTWIEEA